VDYQKNYIQSALAEFKRYKTLGDKTFDQLSEQDIHWTYADSTNSIAIIVKHMVGNMLSRWTNFHQEDGEKTWRNRETEFEGSYADKAEMRKAWEEGWDCLFTALKSINDTNFDIPIVIRMEPHTAFEAINRQLAHYCGHVGQIVVIGKMLNGNTWDSLSIPKGESDAYNNEKFRK